MASIQAPVQLQNRIYYHVLSLSLTRMKAHVCDLSVIQHRAGQAHRGCHTTHPSSKGLMPTMLFYQALGALCQKAKA